MSLSPIFHKEIRQHHLFNGLSVDCFQTIMQRTGLLSLKKNELLFECCFEANHFFLVRTGQITFFQISSDGNEKIVNIYDPGQIFAETIMFIEEQCYPINARATCDTELFYFEVQNFKKQLRKSNELCFSLMTEMSNRLKNQTQEIIELSIYDAQYRLVRYLLEKSCKENNPSCQPVVVLSTTKSLLASRLSITPETFSRILSRLRKQDLITIRDDTIILNEPEKLKDLIGQCSSTLPVKAKKSDLKWTIKKEPAFLFSV